MNKHSARGGRPSLGGENSTHPEERAVVLLAFISVLVVVLVVVGNFTV